MKSLGSLNYVMTLSGPPRRPAPRLMGLFDPITNNPWWLVLGIVGGVVAAHYYGKGPSFASMRRGRVARFAHNVGR